MSRTNTLRHVQGILEQDRLKSEIEFARREGYARGKCVGYIVGLAVAVFAGGVIFILEFI